MPIKSTTTTEGGKGGKIQKNLQNKSKIRVINVGEGVEKREPAYTLGGNAN